MSRVVHFLNIRCTLPMSCFPSLCPLFSLHSLYYKYASFRMDIFLVPRFSPSLSRLPLFSRPHFRLLVFWEPVGSFVVLIFIFMSTYNSPLMGFYGYRLRFIFEFSLFH
ncbi:hypothetical protein BDZ97DRAFT_1201419 [Flammula alnicola]|nr:hypothetical protein BDZ97DRAFT_1201419 [Flammula alnicola]